MSAIIRLGPKEKAIMQLLSADSFTPPSVYMQDDSGRCPSGKVFNRIVYEKQLAIPYYMTLKPEERAEHYRKLTPGNEAVEVNAALKLTPLGLQVMEALTS